MDGVRTNEAVAFTLAVQLKIWNGFAARLPALEVALNDAGTAPGTNVFSSNRLVKSTPRAPLMVSQSRGRYVGRILPVKRSIFWNVRIEKLCCGVRKPYPWLIVSARPRNPLDSTPLELLSFSGRRSLDAV